MNRHRTDAVIALILVGGLIILVLLVARGTRQAMRIGGTPAFGGEAVGLVEVTGAIYDSRHWVHEIDEFRTEKRIKAIVVRFESPGGGVAASQELYEALKRARAVKPVVVSMGGIATSGAYYASLGADSIVANPGTTTGSIGVILELVQFAELMQKLGVGSEVVKSGKFKDAGSPARELTPEERVYFQGYIDDAFSQFAHTVAEERGIDYKQVLKFADGRVFTGQQALKLGLVDVLGDQFRAVNLAGEMAGLEGEPEVVKPPKRHPLGWMDLILDGALQRVIDEVEGRPAFQFRWKPETVR